MEVLTALAALSAIVGVALAIIALALAMAHYLDRR
jgi:hypothetical protein